MVRVQDYGPFYLLSEAEHVSFLAHVTGAFGTLSHLQVTGFL